MAARHRRRARTPTGGHSASHVSRVCPTFCPESQGFSRDAIATALLITAIACVIIAHARAVVARARAVVANTRISARHVSVQPAPAIIVAISFARAVASCRGADAPTRPPPSPPSCAPSRPAPWQAKVGAARRAARKRANRVDQRRGTVACRRKNHATHVRFVVSYRDGRQRLRRA